MATAAEQEREAKIDATLEDTFPASDPPSWTLGCEPHRTAPAMSTPRSASLASPTDSTVSEEVTTLRVIGIAGSLRKASFNRALLYACQQLLPPDMELEIVELSDIPLFNQDLETQPPRAVVTFKEQIRAADAILIATPEYNYSIPGVLKNAIDWGSRPAGENVWAEKPVAILGASVGRFGTARAQYHLRQVFVTLNMYTLTQPEALISSATTLFDAEGVLTDEDTKDRLQRLLKQLALWTRRIKMRIPTA